MKMRMVCMKQEVQRHGERTVFTNANSRASLCPAAEGGRMESTTAFLFLSDVINDRVPITTALLPGGSLQHAIPQTKNGLPRSSRGKSRLFSELTFPVWSSDGKPDHTGCDPCVVVINPSRAGSFPAGRLETAFKTHVPALGSAFCHSHTVSDIPYYRVMHSPLALLVCSFHGYIMPQAVPKSAPGFPGPD